MKARKVRALEVRARERAVAMLALHRDEKLTMQQIGERFGCSKQRVQQIFARERARAEFHVERAA